MSGPNPSKRPNDNNDEESSKRRKENLEEFERLVAQSQEDENRGRSQTRSSGGYGGSRGGKFHRNENVQGDTQSLAHLPTPTPVGTLGLGIPGANPLFQQTAINLSNSNLLNRLNMAGLVNAYIDMSPPVSNDLTSVANFTGNGLVPYNATQGLAQRLVQAQDQSLLVQQAYAPGLIQGQSNQLSSQPGNQRTRPVSTNPPDKSWQDAPRLPRGSQARARGATPKKASTPLTTKLEGSLGQQHDRWSENLTKAWSELRQAQLWDGQGYVSSIFAVFVPLIVARLPGMDILNGLAELTLEKAGGLEDIRLQSKQLERSCVEICVQVAKGKENRTNLLEVWLMLVQWATTLWMGSPIPLTTWTRVWFSKAFPPMTTDSDHVIIFLDSEKAREHAATHKVHEVRQWTKHYNDMANSRRTLYKPCAG
ncbi:hypothetical protein V2G26_017770 [Clonostachys chloroleuca]